MKAIFSLYSIPMASVRRHPVSAKERTPEVMKTKNPFPLTFSRFSKIQNSYYMTSEIKNEYPKHTSRITFQCCRLIMDKPKRMIKKYSLSFLGMLLLLILEACSGSQSFNLEVSDNNYLQWVNPFIGTAAHGHTYPGATVPFGAIQLSPDNGTPGWDWCSGYNYVDSTIVGFSHTHLSGTGIGDLYDILVSPCAHTVNLRIFAENPKMEAYSHTFQHANEKASPGYYTVQFDDGIKAELTASTRVGMHKYSFPKDSLRNLVLDLAYALNWDRPVDTYIKILDSYTLQGYRKSTGWAKDQQLYFTIKFSEEIKNYELFEGNDFHEGSEVTGSKARALIEFGRDSQPLQFKVGISSADLDGSMLSLNEIPHWDFQKTKLAAEALWTEALSPIKVKTKDLQKLEIFYTALYHTQLAPVVYSDGNGWYHGPDGEKHSRSFTRYDIFSLWDTFRAAHPLFTLINTDQVDDMVKSLIAHFEEYGLLPVWSLLGNETNTMTGYHAIPVIVDAYFKGLTSVSPDSLLQAMIRSASQDIRGTNYYRQYGYIPYDKDGQSVTKTLEYAFDDWCIGQMANHLGYDSISQLFAKRSLGYRYLFDSKTGFMRAKMSDGSWKVPFDPYYSDHNFDVAEYTEGNAFQHSWFVPHQIDDLILLHEGQENFVAKLDELFSAKSEISGENVSVDISGLIGQYAHGNEPSHHIAYLYNFAGEPWKTQEKVHHIMSTQYTDQPDGLCGNEDCGQMSAWYVWSALGFYPVNPVQGVYVIGTPAFEEMSVNLPNGNTFQITAQGLSGDHFYIQSATLNNQNLNRSYILHNEIINGGKLEFVMGNTPNKEWATDANSLPPYEIKY